MKIYAKPLTNQILRAGHMGIESELVDADYPTFLVFNKTWEKMKEDFYGGERDKSKAESMKASTEQEMMMVMSIEDLNITNLKSGSQSKPEDINLKEVDSYKDMFQMESSEARIQETLSSGSIEEMMYEEDRFWNIEEITDWDYEFKIEMKSNEYEVHREHEDELE